MTTQSSNQKRRVKGWARTTLALLFILAVVTYGTGSLVSANLMEQNPAPGQMVSAGGFSMHIHCMGEGSPTVYV